MTRHCSADSRLGDSSIATMLVAGRASGHCPRGDTYGFCAGSTPGSGLLPQGCSRVSVRSTRASCRPRHASTSPTTSTSGPPNRSTLITRMSTTTPCSMCSPASLELQLKLKSTRRVLHRSDGLLVLDLRHPCDHKRQPQTATTSAAVTEPVASESQRHGSDRRTETTSRSSASSQADGEPAVATASTSSRPMTVI